MCLKPYAETLETLIKILGEPSNRGENENGEPVITWKQTDDRHGLEVCFSANRVTYDIHDYEMPIGAICSYIEICHVARKLVLRVNPLAIIGSH